MSSKPKKSSQAAATPVKEKAEKIVAPVQKKETEEEDLSGISTVGKQIACLFSFFQLFSTVPNCSVSLSFPKNRFSSMVFLV